MTHQPFRGARRPDRSRPREQARPNHERGHRHHDIRCQEADEEIREAFGRFSFSFR